MRQGIVLLIIGVSIFQRGISFEIDAPRIAIIGGGIGGASTSHFLTELLNGTLNIDLYEAKTIGGRLATINVDGDEIEAGGSIIHPKNMYMQRFVKLLDLQKIVYTSREKMGIWNGDEFVFKSGNWPLESLIKLLYRYGFQIFRSERLINNMIEDFIKIYDLQDDGQSFVNITMLLSAMNKDFPNTLEISARDYLLHLGFSEKLIDELVQAAIVVNYGQEVDIQSFVSCIALAASSDLWSVKGGNKKVPEQLIYRNKNVNVIPSRVTKIRNLANSDLDLYEVTYINKNSTDSQISTYDIVIIAAPLTKDQEFQIEFVDFPNKFVFPGNYQTTHATFIKADLNSKYFDLHEALDSILSCNPNKTIISSIGKVNSVDELIEKKSSVWKIFSRSPMETNIIHQIFSHVTEKKEIAWKAYPQYSTKLHSHSFQLHDALYHVNTIEWAASAMEMSAIAGRNVAILAYNDLLKKTNKYSMFDKEMLKGSTKKSFISDEL